MKKEHRTRTEGACIEMMEIDERTNKSQAVRNGYQRPHHAIDRSHVYGLALTQFLSEISARVSEHLENENGHLGRFDTDSFVGNYGNSYRCDAFIIHCYDWDNSWQNDAWDDTLGDIAPGYLDPNSDCFLDIETGAAVSWYKYVPRGMSVNDAMLDALKSDMLHQMMERAYAEMRRIENEKR